jgi:glycosyltransferase involved in cell wall biosynthesis
MPRLSLLIPSRNEAFLARTCADALEHSGPETEIIAVIDGPSPHTAPEAHPRLRVIELPESIGQRAATNLAARESTAEYVMKVDGHCAFDDGFDRKLLADIQPDWTMAPTMRNLHAFDWACPRGHVRYQGPSGPCTVPDCGLPTTQVIVWRPKPNPASRSFCFDSSPHFQYFGGYLDRTAAKGQGELTESMSLQGSCFMVARDRYHALNLCDEAFGSWGSQGIEVACKSWLSGGKVVVSHKTWYAHMFRTQGGDFSFPYKMTNAEQKRAQSYAKHLFFGDRWPGAVRPLSWLVRRFWPVPGWTEQDLDALPRRGPARAIIFYTDNELDESIARPVREQLDSISREYDLPITSASLRKMQFGQRNIRFPSLKRSNYAMVKQIIGALENTPADIIYFCEHDVLYHPSHFDFVPSDPNLFYYNTNVFQWKYPSGPAVYWQCRKLSQMVCYRELALAHYRRRLERLEANNREYDARMGHEPGTRGTRSGGIDDSLCADFRSATCNVDIRHRQNYSKSKWSPADFRDPAHCIDWQESETVPGWPRLPL